MTPANDAAWAYVPALLRRIRAFCEKQPTDIDADWITKTVIAHFAAGTNNVMAWIVLDHDTVIAHWVVMLEQRGQCLVAYVLQVESTDGLPMSMANTILRDMELWARSHQANVLEGVTWLGVSDGTSEAVAARVFRTLGFEPYRIVVRKTL